MRLPMGDIVHGNDSAKVDRVRPTIKRMRKFPPRTPGEKIQLVALRPTLDLPWRDDKFLVANIARLAVRTPIELLKRGARLAVSGWLAERRNPVSRHAPVIVVPRFALPFVQVCVGNALAAQMADRFQCGPPVCCADIDKHAVYVED